MTNADFKILLEKIMMICAEQIGRIDCEEDIKNEIRNSQNGRIVVIKNK